MVIKLIYFNSILKDWLIYDKIMDHDTAITYEARDEPINGPRIGGSQCRMSILRNDIVINLAAYFSQWPLMNLGNDHIPCHLAFRPMLDVSRDHVPCGT